MSLASLALARCEPRTQDALASAYADLSGQRHSDPAAFRARVAWWARTMADACWMQAGPLQHALVWHADAHVPTQWAAASAGRPVCLSVVSAELARTGSLVRLDEYLRRTAPVGTRGWTAWMRPALTWLRGLAFAEDDSDGDDGLWARVQGDWVVVGNVQRAATLFLAQHDRHASWARRVMTKELITEALAALHDEEQRPVRLSSVDIAALLVHLERDARVLAHEGDVYKLLNHNDAPVITEADRGMAAVKHMQAQLTAQVGDAQRRMSDAQAAVTHAVRTKQRESVALSYLRTKKQLEDMLDKRVQALETISTILLKLEQAADDAQLVRVYESSDKTLRTLLADPALQPERMDATMDALADAAHMQEEVHATMAHGTDDGLADELADELAKLELEVRNESEAATPSDAPLPSAPQHAPQHAPPKEQTPHTEHAPHKEHALVPA